MRTITLIIIHCSATPEGKSLSAEACRQDHILHRRFRDIGYHFYITRDGEICQGGLDMAGRPKDTRTLAQRASLLGLLRELRKIFPKTLIVGHHDLNPMKECPCFNCIKEYGEL